MKVRLNLATTPLVTHRRFLVGSGLTAFIAGVVFVGLGWHVYATRKANAELRVRTEKTRHEMAALEAQRMDLEHILPPGVRVISIEPKQTAGHVEVKFSVGAASDEAELKFLHALEESKQFAEIRVLGEHEPKAIGNLSSDQKVVDLTAVYSRT